MANTNFGTDVVEMMNAWNVITEQARAQFPHANEEQIFEIAKNAMLHTLRIREASSAR